MSVYIDCCTDIQYQPYHIETTQVIQERMRNFTKFSGRCHEQHILLTGHFENRIIVIESGYMGTIPMMLKALDDRVDFRLFTTAPFLYETYQDRIFCWKYEDIRKFETLYSQDLFMRYSSYRSGKFYVNVSADESVKGKTISEMAGLMR